MHSAPITEFLQELIMKYKRIELGDGIGFSTVTDEKFKTSLLTVRFITRLSKETAAENTLGISMLSDTNSRYKTIAEMSEALSELYGSGLSSFASKRGDLLVTGLSASWISGRYAIYGEDIQGEMLKIFSGCLFSPNAENGSFAKENFDIARQELLDMIDSELNSKRAYAMFRAVSNAFRGEPAALRYWGSRESAEAVTPSQAYNAYRRILETAQAEIIFVSAEEDPMAEKIMRDGFAAVQRKPESVSFISPSPLKPEPVSVSEEFDVNQCKMVLAFKTDSDDVKALKMFSILFGELPVSKLFMNVREKKSLCYYCSSTFTAAKRTLVADCGVEREKIEEAKAEILHQLEEMQNGNFTDEDIERALLAIDNSLCQVGDTPSSYSKWYFDCFCDNKTETPAERLEDFRRVTKERIIAAAKSMKLDTGYLMLDKEVKN